MDSVTVESKSTSPRNNDFDKITTEDEYFLQNPSQQQFYKIIAFFMGLFGLNSEHWGWFKRPTGRIALFFYRLQRIIMVKFPPIVSFSQTLYLYLTYKEHEFSALAVMFSIMPVAYVIMYFCTDMSTKALFVRWKVVIMLSFTNVLHFSRCWAGLRVKSASAQTASYKEANIAFMKTIHLYTYTTGKDFSEHKRNYIAQELVKVEKYTRRTTVYIMVSVIICFFAWNTVPIIHNLQNNHDIHNITKRLEVCVHFWMPFDYEFDFYGYMFIQVLGFYCGGVAVVMMVLFDAVNFAFIYHLVGHIRIMKYDLRHGFTEQGLSDKELKRRLVAITRTYCFITDTFGMVTDAFGLNVASIYAQNLVQGGLLLYQIMTTGRNLDTILTFGLMIPIFMGILMLMSFILENVRIQADDIPALVYDLPWESMSVSNQKILLMILNQVQPTLEFKAAFNIKTGVQPAINIIKTTFSYYVMIKSRKEMA